MDITLRFWLHPETYESFIHKFNHDTANFDYEKYKKVFEII